jgi:ribonuclease Z
MSSVTFLGTGNFLVPPERYWNSFVLAGGGLTVLVEPSPSALPRLRRAGLSSADLDAVVISHFHPDHTFGWPFLLLDLMLSGRTKPLEVVGPPGVEAFLADMMRLGSCEDIVTEAGRRIDIRFREVSDTAGLIAFEAVRVDHVPELECYGYIFEIGGARVAYSGDTKPCSGLDFLAANCSTLIVECNGTRAAHSHMDTASLLALRERYPEPLMVATHIGADVGPVPGVLLPNDLEVVEAR